MNGSRENDLPIMMELADLSMSNNRMEEAMDQLLDIVFLDENWNDKAA